MSHIIDQAKNARLSQRLEEFYNLPLVCEDDPEQDMGETNWHALTEHILRYGIAAHLAPQPSFRVFSNMNFYYQPKFPSVYVSPDIMVVMPWTIMTEDVDSYYLEKDGPAPKLVTEVLSKETAKSGDLENKVYIYAMLGIDEYLLVDRHARFLPQRLLLKKLQPDRSWKDCQDADGGITSGLGFRVVWEADDQVRVSHAQTGFRYPRPAEAMGEAMARRAAEEKIKELEAALARLQTEKNGVPPSS